LSAFTYLWNPIGFPGIHPDEGHYMRRGLHISEGLGAQNVPGTTTDSRYDHPYFGQIFLGSIFHIVGYPDSLQPKPGDLSSIEAILSSPRILVGLLAVVDTFLIYKIAEVRYGRNVGFIAAVLFAVMPYGWNLRRVLLEPIQLPFILLSILFAVYYVRDSHDKITTKAIKRNNLLLPSLSGIFLGLAIFTKIPAFTFIPVVAYLIFLGAGNINSIKKSTVKRLKILSLWFIPVILVPMVWPSYAILVGEYDKFIEGINFQTTRASKPLVDRIVEFASWRYDPVLLSIGIAGIVFCTAKREFFFLIWILPFLFFLYIINYVSSFFLIALMPPFCISAAVMVVGLPNIIFKNRRRVKKLLPFAAISAIGVFGLVNFSLYHLSMSRENLSYLEVATAMARYLPGSNLGKSNGDGTETTLTGVDDGVTVIGDIKYYWILKYVFHKHGYDYKTRFNNIDIHTLERILKGSEKVLMIADNRILDTINEKEPDNAKAQLRAERLSEIYQNTGLAAQLGKVEIRTNY
jgi:Dolichyl-phosphate-mannose-protein mannosyltransferase